MQLQGKIRWAKSREAAKEQSTGVGASQALPASRCKLQYLCRAVGDLCRLRQQARQRADSSSLCRKMASSLNLTNLTEVPFFGTL